VPLLPLVPSADGVAGVVLVVASAAWSPAAMNPASALPTAMLTPAAMTRPCMLKLRRAMGAIVASPGKGSLRIA
jgi:hypothetical protein